jgi:hypothetical protein
LRFLFWNFFGSCLFGSWFFYPGAPGGVFTCRNTVLKNLIELEVAGEDSSHGGGVTIFGDKT